VPVKVKIEPDWLMAIAALVGVTGTALEALGDGLVGATDDSTRVTLKGLDVTGPVLSPVKVTVCSPAAVSGGSCQVKVTRPWSSACWAGSSATESEFITPVTFSPGWKPVPSAFNWGKVTTWPLTTTIWTTLGVTTTLRSTGADEVDGWLVAGRLLDGAVEAVELETALDGRAELDVVGRLLEEGAEVEAAELADAVELGGLAEQACWVTSEILVSAVSTSDCCCVNWTKAAWSPLVRALAMASNQLATKVNG